MVRTIIFDLSEVLISGLVGIEKVLSRELALPEDEILPCFVGNWLEELLVGDISEETYLTRIVAREEWPIDVARLKAVIRSNFHHQVKGTIDLLMDLAGCHHLALLSDNAREWVSYVRSVHPFLEVFQRTFFSYDLKGLKKDPATFSAVLDAMSASPGECLFIDDNPLNVSAAESAGIPSVHFVGAEQLAAELDGKLLSS
ncbi:MAG: HAD-IA family hydrolase [Anaerolineae bacterium]|nr:MAG: HAD-IA family hydrolase [Anaerolineae bacterium]